MRTHCSEAEVRAAFEGRFGGLVTDVRRHGTGHIHDSFVLGWQRGGATVRLLAQRFNTDVFGDPAPVMQNILRVTEHVRAKLTAAGVSDVDRRVLTVQPAPDGALSFVTEAGTFRAFLLIEQTEAFDVATRGDHALAAGAAFGGFVSMLEDLPGGPLSETIAGFHDTPRRLEALRSAFARDVVERASSVAAEYAQIEGYAELAQYCARAAASGALPRQTVHNDAKLSNLLFDVSSHEALCVVDLDTVMPGYALYDFGDLVRTTACSIAEDARDTSQLEIRFDLVEALARGYLQAQAREYSEAERNALARGASMICLELSMRFLTDHLQGDTYFAISRPNQNLDRARAQLALLRELERHADELRACVAK